MSWEGHGLPAPVAYRDRIASPSRPIPSGLIGEVAAGHTAIVMHFAQDTQAVVQR
ncbi:hypothetical protein [Streptomyces sp. NPDC005262]|uniref:hypothetical protein n=1 Tax=Streptomyces sp. NPDC005262 TaxID=3364710 RepID=UPI00369EED83